MKQLRKIKSAQEQARTRSDAQHGTDTASQPIKNAQVLPEVQARIAAAEAAIENALSDDSVQFLDSFVQSGGE